MDSGSVPDRPAIARSQRLGRAALLLTISGGLILVPSYLWELPAPVIVVGGVLWLAGLFSVCIASVRVARAQGVGLLRGSWEVIRLAGRWVWEFLP
ncbi:MAG: hypothetical protein GEU78_17560 [Actinobacteria bacterium]|nr:hypothetical protein [Actinomycetota bacterium]